MFREEFPDFPPFEFPALPEGFEDTSWRNDACPSMTGRGLVIWCDRAHSASRAIAGHRFAVVRADDPYSRPVLETDNWSDVLAFVERG